MILRLTRTTVLCQFVGPNGYVLKTGIGLPPSMTTTLTTSDSSNTMLVAFAHDGSPSDIGVAFLPFGYRYSDKDYVSSNSTH